MPTSSPGSAFIGCGSQTSLDCRRADDGNGSFLLDDHYNLPQMATPILGLLFVGRYIRTYVPTPTSSVSSPECLWSVVVVGYVGRGGEEFQLHEFAQQHFALTTDLPLSLINTTACISRWERGWVGVGRVHLGRVQSFSTRDM